MLTTALKFGTLLASLSLAGCLATTPATPGPRMDEVPMYGGQDRSAPALAAADRQLIAQAATAFGSTARAAQAWIEQGYRFYQADQLGMATRRFNQAWLLDPDNPEVYAGFAAVLHDQARYCDALQMMERALQRNPPTFQGMYADAGRLAARCAMQDGTLSEAERQTLLARSDALYRQGEAQEPDQAYLYSSWATAYTWRGQYADAWRMVFKARQAGARIGTRFLNLLRAKMPEPAQP